MSNPLSDADDYEANDCDFKAGMQSLLGLRPYIQIEHESLVIVLRLSEDHARRSANQTLIK